MSRSTAPRRRLLAFALVLAVLPATLGEAPPPAQTPRPKAARSAAPEPTSAANPREARAPERPESAPGPVEDAGARSEAHRIDPDASIALEPVPAALKPATGTGAPSLGTDSAVNDPEDDVSCELCGNRPAAQAEATIAIHGDHALAGWNETQGFCTGGAVQAYAYSVDGGATWVDAGGLPALRDGGRYRGDPVHTVNHATGEFYLAGLYEGGIPGSGLAIARGHFAGNAFVIDDQRQIAVGGPDVLDKEWITADSLTGNLYVTYTRFIAGTTRRVEFMRSRDRGVTWDAPLAMHAPAQDGKAHGSRVVAGPDGEVYVVWYEEGRPRSHVRIRRSDDFGASFGGERTVCDFYENHGSGAPGFRRGHGVAFPGIAIDASPGPHRGRVYVTWDESVNTGDAPLGSGPNVSSRENDGFFAGATPFAIGSVLRGRFSTPADLDFFRFTGARGQTVVLRADSVSSGSATAMRLVCSADTTSMANYRFLAFSQDSLPEIAFTLASDGTYYLRLQSATAMLPSYRIRTAFDTPSAGERARDHRDPFVSWSDDGASWSEPQLLADSDPWFDSVYPEVTVDGTGAAHVFWHDFRDDAIHGAESHEYLVSSGDGGISWGLNRRISDAPSFWSYNACGNANQGDYQGIASDGRTVIACWADARRGDPDVFAQAMRFEAPAACAVRDTSVAGGSEVVLRYTLDNHGSAGREFEWSVETPVAWGSVVTPGIADVTHLGPDESRSLEVRLALPASCDGTADTVRFIVGDLAVPGRLDTCLTLVRCASAAAVDRLARSTWFLAPPEPNPSGGSSSLRFGLPRASRVVLEVFDVSGARVRQLSLGERGAGEHEARWDGADDDGRRVRPGLYFARLSALGQTLRRVIVRL